MIVLFGGLALVLYIEQAASERIATARGGTRQGLARSIANTVPVSLVEHTREVDLLGRSSLLVKADLIAPDIRNVLDDIKNTHHPYA